MDEEIAVSIENVSKRFLLPHEKKNSIKSVFTSLFGAKTTFTNQKALNNISLEIKKGEFFGIVGRNGSGKSTLLKIIAGIYQPTEGSVHVNGKLVPFIELGVGFNPELTGRENVYLNGAILGFNRKQISANYKKIVDFAELEEHMDVKLKNYSSGMQVRLAFACATMAEADILLVDEILAVGDADFQRKCFNYFKKIKKVGTTVIFVTHDMGAVREFCDKVALVSDAEIKAVGKSEEIAMSYLRLFSDENIPKSDNMSQRWGNNKIKYIKKPIIDVGDKVKITINLVAKYELDNVIFGFLIENTTGEPVLGTNSLIINKSTTSMHNNEKVHYFWEFDNIFSQGEYAVTVSVMSSDGATVYDWWHNAEKFYIKNTQNTPYLVSPKVALKS